MKPNEFIDIDIHQKPLIKGTNVKVEDVAYCHEDLGWTAEKIAKENNVSETAVNNALAYYFDHMKEIRASMEHEKHFRKIMKEKYADFHI